ncbi:MAG: ribosome biogenesis GTPase Der [Alphaproteobacteria bacterium]|jgi:GTP-binding protein
MHFTVAIVGRPNVGKSTLFNRLVGRRHALVDDSPGVTRDRREGEASLGPLRFTVVDTAGLVEAAAGSLEARMLEQTTLAAETADVSLLVVDGRAGVTPDDRYFADAMRKLGRSVILLVNKCEGKAGEDGLFDAYSLGMGDPVAISAEHGRGMNELYDALEPYGGELGSEDEEDTDKPLQLAIVGRPNAGKSTLLNRLVGEERAITGPEPGITRDAIAVAWSHQGRPIKLVDTAGMRRRAKVIDKLEKLSVGDTLRVIRMAEIVLLLLEADMALERQDLTIARMVAEEGRGLVIVVNKWDTVARGARKSLLKNIQDRLAITLPQVRDVPLITLSALHGEGVDKLLPKIIKTHELWNKRVTTSRLNRWLEGVLAAHPPPMASGRRIKIRYMTQVKARPPTFALFVSRPKALPDAYQRYLINQLRDAFKLDGVPIRLLLRAGKNPYAPDR